MDGFIKIHRGLLEWGWYKDANTMRVFMDILLNANYHDGEYMGHPVKAGQCVVGRKALAERLGISEQSVRTALSHLKSTGEITIKTTNKFSIVTIENWGKYQIQEERSNQQSNQQANQQLTNNQPTTNQQLTTSKKERKKERKNTKALDMEFEELWFMYPKKQGKAQAKKAYEKDRISGVSFEDVKRGVERYVAYIEATETDMKYIKMGSSFFNQRAWGDEWEIPKARAKPKSNTYTPEPPKYPEFEPEPEAKGVPMPKETEDVIARLKGMF